MPLESTPYTVSLEPVVRPQEADQLMDILKKRRDRPDSSWPGQYAMSSNEITIALQGFELRRPVIEVEGGINPMLELILNTRHFDMKGVFERMFRYFNVSDLSRAISYDDLTALREVLTWILHRNLRSFKGMHPHGIQTLRLREERFSLEGQKDEPGVWGTFLNDRLETYHWFYVPLDQSWTVKRDGESLQIPRFHAFIPKRNDLMCFDQTQISEEGLCRTCLIFDPYHGV